MGLIKGAAKVHGRMCVLYLPAVQIAVMIPARAAQALGEQ
jgi:hypothetical protein